MIEIDFLYGIEWYWPVIAAFGGLLGLMGFAFFMVMVEEFRPSSKILRETYFLLPASLIVTVLSFLSVAHTFVINGEQNEHDRASIEKGVDEILEDEELTEIERVEVKNLLKTVQDEYWGSEARNFEIKPGVITFTPNIENETMFLTFVKGAKLDEDDNLVEEVS